jgi:hypothetical protein
MLSYMNKEEEEENRFCSIANVEIIRKENLMLSCVFPMMKIFISMHTHTDALQDMTHLFSSLTEWIILPQLELKIQKNSLMRS